MSVGAIEERQDSASVSVFADLFELTKPRITLMVVITAAAGFLLASPNSLPLALFINTLLGTALVSAGGSALNHVLERESDAKMRRTAKRPLPTGRLGVELALGFGVILSVAGLVYLAQTVNLLTALLGAGTIAGYLFVYTPLKSKTSLATVIGAVPGAVPPVMGWTAVTGQLHLGAWALFGILFVWQLPHFLAIAWMYKEDYGRGGFPMLPVQDKDGSQTARQMILWCAALIPVSLAPSALGLTGVAYFLGALVAGAWFLASCFGFSREPNATTARKVLLVSVTYLPAILGAMVLDRLF